MFTDPIKERSGTVSNWDLECDSITSYKPTSPDGKPNYLPNDVQYRYNAHGFRCDEFTEDADIRILFLGCSFTEGTGLPISDLWTTHLVNKVRALWQNKDKKIPFWSLAVAGSSIDANTRRLVEFIALIKPTHIIYLMSGIYRREFLSLSPELCLQQWLPHSKSQKIQNTLPYDEVGRVFSDKSFALYQTYRSLTILSQLVKLTSTKLFIINLWGNDPDEQKLFSLFPNISYFESIIGSQHKKPISVPVYFPAELQWITSRPQTARDLMHPGAKWQYQRFIEIWDIVGNEFSVDTGFPQAK